MCSCYTMEVHFVMFLMAVSVINCQTAGSGDIRLSRVCRGNFEIYRDGGTYGSMFYDVCDRSFGVEEAEVVCRQLGCNPVGARKTSASLGYFVTYVISEGYQCSGLESSLSQCTSGSGVCGVGSSIEREDQVAFVAIICGPTPPSEPQDLLVEGVSATALNVSWRKPADTSDNLVTSAQVILVDPRSGQERVIATIRDPSYQEEYIIRNAGLTENTTYTVKVRAASSEEGFGPAASAMGTTLSIALPQRPLDMPDVQYSDTAAEVTWEHPGGTVDTYIVQYSLFIGTFVTLSANTMTLTVTGTQTSVHITNLQPGTRYRVGVATRNGNGVSDYSPLASFITGRGPTTSPPPTPSRSTSPPFTRSPPRITRPPSRDLPPTGSSATTQAIGLAVGVALPVVFSIALFCIVFCISKRSRRILASGPARHQTHASSNATTVHRIQPMSNLAYGQHVDQTRYGQHPQPMDNPTYNMHALPAVSNGVGGEATPPTYQETLVSAEPPTYDAVQENKDLYNVSLPPSYPAGPPNSQHLPS